ncbi:hypothetical protein BT96DRAFT_912738 [Gymnopus androsaceus JB14]|uniref:Yeast cell wall synthesis Kre9/Knh1-like N-terminal domain-containing protein n=1 Tax=Gymnopus androsaceus JB14 TaxID=1447944 RepID=A0A6A4IEA5_9AGAR|nr:hypothetical protein BT96DRAFT_912738 [Gymnopus androsaceus JB14]
MKSFPIQVLLLAFLSEIVAGTFTPTAPGPNYTVNAGSPCVIEWVSDPSWTNLTITLMSGNNYQMVPVTTVASGLDGSDASLSPYKWTAPKVTPYSAIYFFQFTNGDDTANSTWTTRFTIASPSGQSTPPANSTQPNGGAIPWGVGTLASNSGSTTTTSPSSQTSSSSSTRMRTMFKTPITTTRVATPTLSVPSTQTTQSTTTTSALAFQSSASHSGNKNSANFLKMQAFGAWTILAWFLVSSGLYC